jgi:polysaccharide export outer membrane protein
MKKIFLIINFILFIGIVYAQEESPLQKSEEGKSGQLAYKIKPGDSLEVSVYGEPDMVRTVKVNEEGKINYTFTGEVKIAGLTVKEAAQEIETLLKDGYFVNPQVNIFVKEYAKFFVVGAVRSEGQYELKGNLSLPDAIALAGGAKDNADLSRVKVVRKKGADIQEYILDLETQGKNFLLEPTDRVVVEEYGKISVLGEVSRPDNYYLTKNTTLFDAIALAGGVKENADLSKIEVTRIEEGQTKDYFIDLSTEGKKFILKSQDSIFVRAYNKISVLGQVHKPGNYSFREGMTAVDAIAIAGGFTEIANQNAVQVVRVKEDKKKETFYVPVGDILRTGDKSKDIILKEGDVISVAESFF